MNNLRIDLRYLQEYEVFGSKSKSNRFNDRDPSCARHHFDHKKSENDVHEQAHTLMPDTRTGGCLGTTGRIRVTGIGTPEGVIDSDSEGLI